MFGKKSQDIKLETINLARFANHCQKPLDKSYYLHCKVIICRNPIEANANTVAIQLPGNPAAYIGKCFTPY